MWKLECLLSDIWSLAGSPEVEEKIIPMRRLSMPLNRYILAVRYNYPCTHQPPVYWLLHRDHDRYSLYVVMLHFSDTSEMTKWLFVPMTVQLDRLTRAGQISKEPVISQSWPKCAVGAIGQRLFRWSPQRGGGGGGGPSGLNVRVARGQ